ncbi:DNA helicase UvrBC [Candidatus Poribacteria bacterium]|nr:DNA helicase UvrBC [Candidatus Poribacteria bacterium]
MSTDHVDRNTRLIQTFDEILDSLAFDASHPIQVLRVADGREVVIVQPNTFTISRIYASGRPDGKKPHGRNSYYDYFCEQLEDYKRQRGSDEGFRLTPEDWRALFQESYDRYTRYLFFAGLKRWADVKRDTKTNIAVAEMAREYAPSNVAWGIYQYKGYMLMMNGIANAELGLIANDRQDALRQIDLGIQRMGQFCGECLREGYGDAENITRERYLSNLIEYRTDLESLEAGLENQSDHSEGDDDDNDDWDILDELEELLDEENENEVS